MSKKSEIKREISDLENEIDALEKKRQRSQSALLTAVVSNKKPDPQDVEYFRVFTDIIEKDRERLRELYRLLNNK